MYVEQTLYELQQFKSRMIDLTGAEDHDFKKHSKSKYKKMFVASMVANGFPRKIVSEFMDTTGISLIEKAHAIKMMRDRDYRDLYKAIQPILVF